MVTVIVNGNVSDSSHEKLMSFLPKFYSGKLYYYCINIFVRRDRLVLAEPLVVTAVLVKDSAACCKLM